jgi:hypothetical protein
LCRPHPTEHKTSCALFLSFDHISHQGRLSRSENFSHICSQDKSRNFTITSFYFNTSTDVSLSNSTNIVVTFVRSPFLLPFLISCYKCITLHPIRNRNRYSHFRPLYSSSSIIFFQFILSAVPNASHFFYFYLSRKAEVVQHEFVCPSFRILLFSRRCAFGMLLVEIYVKTKRRYYKSGT